MKRSHLWSGLLFAAVCAIPVAGAEAADKQQEVTVVKTRDGLRFKIPPDWPIEKRNGVVAPIPVEEYMTQKFFSLESRLRDLEKQVASMELRLRLLEEESKRGKGLQSTEGAVPSKP